LPNFRAHIKIDHRNSCSIFLNRFAMDPQKKARRIQKILEELYPQPAIPLNHRNPYTLLIAVILSGRCTDARVNQITPALFRKASTPEAMVRLGVQAIQEIIRPCGLSPQKAQAIHKLSELILQRHAGRVPNTFEELEALPGVGHKSASVVMSQAFHQSAFPIDTHIERCAHRWGLTTGRGVVQTEKELKQLFPQESWNRLHLQMIYFAREYCPARGHDSASCPICSWACSSDF
jgi:endonuclease-3